MKTKPQTQLNSKTKQRSRMKHWNTGLQDQRDKLNPTISLNPTLKKLMKNKKKKKRSRFRNPTKKFENNHIN